MSYTTVAGHRSMALDVRRNAHYADALRQVIRPDSVVLDVGAGTGILGLMAARLGARRVYLVDPSPVLAVAQEIAIANDLQDRIVCLQERIEDSALPEPADIIVSALTGNFLVTEDLLGALFHARDHALAPGGILIPSAARMEAVPVFAPDLHASEIAAWAGAQEDVHLTPGRAYAANTVFYRAEGLGSAVWLAEPVSLATLDFSEATDTGVHTQTSCEMTRSGLCHGWLGWFSMKLGEHWLSTSPRELALHWRPAFLPLDPPLPVQQGEQMQFALDRAPFGDWTWRVRAAAGERRHSTLLSRPLTPAALHRDAADAVPVLREQGRIVSEILKRCDGTATLDAIVEAIYEQHAASFETKGAAARLVRRTVADYT